MNAYSHHALCPKSRYLRLAVTELAEHLVGVLPQQGRAPWADARRDAQAHRQAGYRYRPLEAGVVADGIQKLHGRDLGIVESLLRRVNRRGRQARSVQSLARMSEW